MILHPQERLHTTMHPDQSQAIRYVVRNDQHDGSFYRIGVWTPATGYVSETELNLPSAIIEEAVPEGVTVVIDDVEEQLKMIEFANTGTLDLHWVFFDLLQKAKATRQGMQPPIMRPERDYCGWNWPANS
jgi:hypothetical protein